MNLELNGWHGSCVVSGAGAGPLLRLDAALSFWGGVDAQTGKLIEPGHPQHGALLGGRVLLMERAKGSSSSSSVLAEILRNGTGPAALVMREPDLIVGLGCIVASELYGLQVPIVAVDAATWSALLQLAPGSMLRVSAEAQHGTVVLDGAAV